MTDISQPQQSQPRRPSPALILFLLFPLVGLIAAAIVIVTNAPANGGVVPTPEPVTLPPAKAVANSPMIDFALTSMDGQTVHLSDYAGRMVFLNFWATWCTPCQKELPDFAQFQAQQAADGPEILSVDVAEDKGQVETFLTEFSITGLNVLLDPDAKAADSYGVFNLPVTFVIDRRGIVRYPKYGPMTIDDLNAYVAALKAAT